MHEPVRDEHRIRDAEADPARAVPEFTPTDALVEAVAGLPPIDYKQFRRDVDAILDQDPTPRFWPDS